MPERKSLKEALNGQQKSLEQTLSKEDAIAFVEGKIPETGSTVKKKRNSMKDIKSHISSNDTKANGYKKRMTTDVPPEIHQRLKFALADMKTDSNKLMNALLVNFLDENDY